MKKRKFVIADADAPAVAEKEKNAPATASVIAAAMRNKVSV